MARTKKEKSQETSIVEETSVKATPPKVNEEPSITKEQIEFKKPKKIRVKKIAQVDAVRYNPEVHEGLNTQQVEERLMSGLSNDFKNKYSRSIFSIIMGNLFTFFNFMCIIVLIAYIIVGAKLSNFIFVLPFSFNLIIGIIQEIKAKLSVEKLSLLQAPTATVVRNSTEREVNVSDILLDDIYKLTMGNQIPVDGIVKEGFIEVNESLLTGESIAVKKNVGDTIFAGSFVTSGSCYAIADRVAEECYVQTLTAKAKKFKKPHSELMVTLSWIIKIIGVLIIPISIGIGLVNYNAFTEQLGTTIENHVVTRTGAVILGMIPSGLMLLTTMALSLGVIRLFKRNTLVQNMYSLEMLARVDVLCLDKTGTITDGRMTVVDEILLTDHPYPLNNIIGTMEKVLDDSNQTAIALRAHYLPDVEYVPTKIITFSSARKFSAITFKDIGTYAIGAPEFILKDIPEKVNTEINRNAMLGNRVLVLAHSPAQIIGKDGLPATMKAIALIVITDNIREDAIETIKWFKENDVQVKVISGDNPVTVSEIAKRAGIENASNWISLDGLSEKEIVTIADKYTVFGRVSPGQKAILVKALKRAGHTVAMTGDGVNDILAMRESDCSITVASGADSAKNIAHIVLVDNNFNSMPKVVSEGRRVINNIQQSASLYIMKTIFITVLALVSIITVKSFPFESGMLSMLELTIIGLASFILSIQPNDKRVEGDFLSTVIGNALPGALILLFNVYFIQIAGSIFVEFFPPDITIEQKASLITTLQVVSFTFGGFVYLCRICQPFNSTRIILIFSILLILLAWVAVFLDTTNTLKLPINFFNLYPLFPPEKDTWGFLVLILCLVELNYLLVDNFIKFAKFLIESLTVAGNKKTVKR